MKKPPSSFEVDSLIEKIENYLGADVGIAF